MRRARVCVCKGASRHRCKVRGRKIYEEAWAPRNATHGVSEAVLFQLVPAIITAYIQDWIGQERDRERETGSAVARPPATRLSIFPSRKLVLSRRRFAAAPRKILRTARKMQSARINRIARDCATRTARQSAIGLAKKSLRYILARACRARATLLTLERETSRPNVHAYIYKVYHVGSTSGDENTEKSSHKQRSRLTFFSSYSYFCTSGVTCTSSPNASLPAVVVCRIRRQSCFAHVDEVSQNWERELLLNLSGILATLRSSVRRRSQACRTHAYINFLIVSVFPVAREVGLTCYDTPCICSTPTIRRVSRLSLIRRRKKWSFPRTCQRLFPEIPGLSISRRVYLEPRAITGVQLGDWMCAHISWRQRRSVRARARAARTLTFAHPRADAHVRIRSLAYRFLANTSQRWRRQLAAASEAPSRKVLLFVILSNAPGKQSVEKEREKQKYRCNSWFWYFCFMIIAAPFAGSGSCTAVSDAMTLHERTIGEGRSGAFLSTCINRCYALSRYVSIYK